ncbi:26s proteasome non-ATPase regulatory subunit 3 [Chrysochromulina tobinii]|uniref:26s proteasome non-ATPase regulatory subunit 3 n=1 Tax=Chrysochromulina tobinii TaxID=1460289 RepID=A0A0M0JIB9_9EUKA|nr:26s proteasome non-ATPase regulatory subunit 3 [Chrysochromulina tobinii]|eukprot:KOO26356.1 26s proteasome non-ATPase regulatory subunit 3 [Chrysochromulina sp. CCMP291]
MPEKMEEQLIADLSAAFAVLERFVNAREPRHMVQALRVLGPFRKKGKESPGVAVGALMAALSTHVAPSAALRAPMLALLGMLPQPAEPVPAPAASEDKDDEKKASISKLPENEVLVGLLVLTLLLDHNQVIAAVPFSLQLMERVGALKRRTLDPIAERVYFYASWAHEVNGTLVAIRSPLLAAHRTACLHHNSTCQATLLNLLLRNYQHYKLFDQAEKLLTKTTFPESAGATQLARYLYYTGRIKALQLEYTEAHRCLLQAQRKAPTTKGLGFRLAVYKLARAPMRPYLELVQAVRLGDLAAFRMAMEKHAATFTADSNYTLIVRLRQNVIRAGLRNISLAYSRIALSDVAAKLVLDHPEDMESIAAKAIRDGVIEATLDHANAVLISKDPTDVYSTLEPQAAFHKRITFCLNVHNDAVKAMSYPPDAHKDGLLDADAMKQRQLEEAELAEALAEEDYE